VRRALHLAFTASRAKIAPQDFTSWEAIYRTLACTPNMTFRKIPRGPRHLRQHPPRAGLRAPS
jgi:hypothetical protein